MSRYGRIQVPEPPSALRRLHVHDGSIKLRAVDHEPKLGVLDQEDLLAQGIRCSTFIPGAGDPDALGSCTANTLLEALSNLLSPQAFAAFIAQLGAQQLEQLSTVYTNVAGAERAAIGFYHRCTDQTGDPAQEWPPTDCGSSGVYVVQLAKRLGVCAGARIASGADNLVSLMQSGGIMCGTPFFNAWEEPDNAGFIDGNGTASDLESAIASGLAGGHEFYLSAIEKLVLLPSGHVDPLHTVIRWRNHWDPSWGDHGSARVHLSTLVSLGSHADFRQLTPLPQGATS